MTKNNDTDVRLQQRPSFKNTGSCSNGLGSFCQSCACELPAPRGHIAVTDQNVLVEGLVRKQIAPSFGACTYGLFGSGDGENEICALQEHFSPMHDGQVRSAVSATAVGSKPGRVTIVTKFLVDGTKPPHGPYIFRDRRRGVFEMGQIGPERQLPTLVL